MCQCRDTYCREIEADCAIRKAGRREDGSRRAAGRARRLREAMMFQLAMVCMYRIEVRKEGKESVEIVHVPQSEVEERSEKH